MSVKPNSTPVGRRAQRRRPIINVNNRDKETRPTDSKRPYDRKGRYPTLTPVPCSEKKATSLLEQWAKDRVFCLLYVDRFPTLKLKSRQLLSVSQKEVHTLRQCMLFRKFFNGRLKGAKFCSQKTRPLMFMNLRFPSIRIEGKVTP